MRFLTVVLFLSLCGPAAAQKVEGPESEFLKALAGKAGASSVAEARSGAVPALAPLKIFVLSPGQEDVQKNFREWAEEWNRSEGEKYGRVEFVEDATRADVILARFLTPFKGAGLGTRQAGEESWTREGSPSSRGVAPMPFPGPGASSALPARATPYYRAKAYCYVAAREGGGLRLMWRGTDSVRVSPAEVRSPDDLAFAKGEKDSRIVGDRLRDQFFKLLRARGRPRDE